MIPSADDLYREAQWEMKGIRQAAQLYREASASLSPSELPSGQWLLREIVPGLAQAIRKEQETGLVALGRTLKQGYETGAWALPLQLLTADELALITTIVGFDAVRGGQIANVLGLAKQIAHRVQDELGWRVWTIEQKQSVKHGGEDLLGRLQRRYPMVTRKVWSKWQTKIGLLRAAKWSETQEVSFGSTLLGILCQSSPEHFSTVSLRDGNSTVKRLRLSDETAERLSDIETRREVLRPRLMPMVIPPIPWEYAQPERAVPIRPLESPPLTGGFVIHKQKAVRSTVNAHTTALPGQYLSPEDIAALNTVQGTGWRINTWILDVMGEAWATGQRLGGLEVGEPMSVPDRIPDETWATFTKEQQSAHKSALRTIHGNNASLVGKSQAVLDFLSVATELREEPAIWFPHRKDFRHRIYPDTSAGPTPQGSDLSKSLLMFADGKPLGPDGYGWLCIRAANCWGQKTTLADGKEIDTDKATLQERIQWTLDNMTSILGSVAAPLDFTWWTAAAEPWSFLATCQEISMASQLSGETVTDFVSHLPIPLDGSCNGLQHLAALGLDPIGARATNLTADPVRQDVYQEVANRVNALIALDDAAVRPTGLPNVTRKTVKRAVMTTPYGVTPRGIRDQLVNDGMTEATAPGASSGQQADYLRDKIVQALGDTVASARGIMTWLQMTAEQLARAGVPFDWTTPSGSRVRQAYYESTAQEIRTLIGRTNIMNENLKGNLIPRKQLLGSAPNFIHSFDAAHLTLTVNASAHIGIGSFAMIHDSYGTHACDTSMLGVILRREFVGIYREDWLQKVYNDVKQSAPMVEPLAPPKRGAFDINQVELSEYFFS